MATNRALDELLTTLDVRVHAVGLCDIRVGHRLVFAPMGMVTVHYVLEGAGVIDVGGAPPVSFGPRSVLIVPPGGRVRLGPADDAGEEVAASDVGRFAAGGLLVLFAGEGPTALRIASGTITATYGGGFGLFEHLPQTLVEDVSEVDVMAAAIEQLLQEVKSPGLATQAYTEALMRQCLLLILRSHFARSGPQSPLFAPLRDERLTRAVARVLRRPGERHTLQSLADEARMSRTAFAARFTQTYNQTPFEFIQKVRLRHAAHLLHATDLPVKMIAAAAGFVSRSHFSRLFRTAYGVDPTRYRGRMQEADALSAPTSAATTASE